MAKAKTPQIPTHEMLRDRVAVYMQEEQKLLNKHGLTKRIVVTFPKHLSTPLFGRLGVWFLKRSSGIIDTEFGMVVNQK
jgi:hypothetical protein